MLVSKLALSSSSFSSCEQYSSFNFGLLFTFPRLWHKIVRLTISTFLLQISYILCWENTNAHIVFSFRMSVGLLVYRSASPSVRLSVSMPISTTTNVLVCSPVCVCSHFCSLQACLWWGGPSLLQLCPPLFGGGFVQLRERFWNPPPQVALHSPQVVQFVYPPFTGTTMGLLKDVIIRLWTSQRILQIPW